MLTKLSLSYIFKYFIVTGYFKFCISSLVSDCGTSLVRFFFLRLLHRHKYLILKSAVLFIPIQQFLIKRELVHIRLQITLSVFSLLSYCGNLSISAELSNTKEIQGSLCGVWQWLSRHTLLAGSSSLTHCGHCRRAAGLEAPDTVLLLCVSQRRLWGRSRCWGRPRRAEAVGERAFPSARGLALLLAWLTCALHLSQPPPWIQEARWNKMKCWHLIGLAHKLN